MGSFQTFWASFPWFLLWFPKFMFNNIVSTIYAVFAVLLAVADALLDSSPSFTNSRKGDIDP